MTNYFIMTEKEIDRISILDQVINKDLTQIQAWKILWLSDRQIRRLLKRVNKYWKKWIIHRSRGKPSNRWFKKKFIKEIVDIISNSIYSWFWPSLLSEELKDSYNITISNESLRNIMITNWLWIPNKRKIPKQFFKRNRKACKWELIQFDWSYHPWFEDRNWWEHSCLLLAIDDATWAIMHAVFDFHEWIIPVFSFWREYVCTIWKPRAIYLDKFSTYKVNYPNWHNPSLTSQFQRINQSLWIETIFANTPQAKWRVERANKTLQDRLVKKLRLLWINNIHDANNYLKDSFIKEFNKQFAVNPTSKHDFHTKLSLNDTLNIDRIYSTQHTRTIANDFTIQFKNKFYQLYQWIPTIYPKRKVLIDKLFNGGIFISYRNKDIRFKQIKSKTIVNKSNKNKYEILNRKQQKYTISKKKQYHYNALNLLKKQKSIQQFNSWKD